MNEERDLRQQVSSVLKRVMYKGRTTISVLLPTKEALDSIKHVGQSYDSLIQELVKFWKEKKREYWTRRREQRKAGVGSQL